MRVWGLESQHSAVCSTRVAREKTAAATLRPPDPAAAAGSARADRDGANRCPVVDQLPHGRRDRQRRQRLQRPQRLRSACEQRKSQPPGWPAGGGQGRSGLRRRRRPWRRPWWRRRRRQRTQSGRETVDWHALAQQRLPRFFSGLSGPSLPAMLAGRGLSGLSGRAKSSPDRPPPPPPPPLLSRPLPALPDSGCSFDFRPSMSEKDSRRRLVAAMQTDVRTECPIVARRSTAGQPDGRRHERSALSA